MKSIISIIFVLITIGLQAQEITVEKIWKNYEYYGSSVQGFRSMNDGNYFVLAVRNVFLDFAAAQKVESTHELLGHFFDFFYGVHCAVVCLVHRNVPFLLRYFVFAGAFQPE